jgi:hypothetical protein
LREYLSHYGEKGRLLVAIYEYELNECAEFCQHLSAILRDESDAKGCEFDCYRVVIGRMRSSLKQTEADKGVNRLPESGDNKHDRAKKRVLFWDMWNDDRKK